jgi:hypothetical protein
MGTLLMIIDEYSIGGYWCLLIDIILMVIVGYWWLFRCKPSVVNFIGGY